MSSDAHVKTNYFTIIVWLTVLTVLEIGVTFLHMNRMLLGVLLVGMALGKAAMVAAYFMHLKFETRTLSLIAVTPLLICTLLIFMMLPDASWTWRPN